MTLDILLVDDDPDFAAATADLLRDDGYQVCVAKDGASALVLARELRPDAVLLDLGLPDANGYDIARGLRGALSDTTPIIVITGRREALHGVDVDLMLHKPIQVELCGSLIEHVRRQRWKAVTARPLR